MSVITVGNFDGVHLGHRRLLSCLRNIADERGERAIAVTFCEHSVGELTGKRFKVISDRKTKEKLLLSAGADEVVFLDFKKFSSMSGENFLKYLKEKLGLSAFVAGEDFRFGRNAAFGIDRLREQSGKMNFILKTVSFGNEPKISSSNIRRLIEDGKVDEAEKLLGYRFFIRGEISSGKHLGRKLGFPTLNIVPPENAVLPKYGVYATDTEADGKKYLSVSNVGVRPTVENTDIANVESYIIGQDINAADGEVIVYFKKFIRPEKKFESAEALAAGIAADCAEAEKIV